MEAETFYLFVSFWFDDKSDICMDGRNSSLHHWHLRRDTSSEMKHERKF